MYEAFYGFKEKPFSMLPDPSFLFLSKKHRAALTLLEYGLLNHVGFCVISGEPGAGKTTVLRALLERVPDNVTVGLITNTHQSFGGLLDWILSAFDLHQPNLTHVEMHQLFMDFLIEEYANNRTVLLIIDEAQNITSEVLEELRMLSNVNTEKDQLMQVMLAGQPALKATLRKPELMQFAQRIAVDYHLEPLGVKETCGYIQHRLITAGAERDIFTPAACERIHSYSGGTPRLINLLCETVLVYGFADQLDMIDVDLVDEMVQERMKDSVVPIVNRDAAKKDNKQASKELEQDFPWIKSMIEKQDLTAKTETSTVKTPVVKERAKQASSIIDEPTVIKSADKTAVIDDKLSYVNAGTEKPVEPEKKAPKKKASMAERKSSQEIPLKTKQKAPQDIPKKIQDEDLAPSVTTKVEGRAGKSLVKSAIFSVLIVSVLIVLALLFNGNISTDEVFKWATNKYTETIGTLELQKQSEQEEARLKKLQIEAEALIKQREQEEARVKKLQTEAEALKKERDAAIAKAEKEKRDKQQAEKLAAEESALEAKAAEEKRLAEIEKREQLTKQREAKAWAEAARIKDEAARLAEEKALMEARLEEEKIIKQQEARRLAREQQEIERQQQLLQQQEAKIRAEQLAAAEAAAIATAKAKEEAESKPSECNGPAARYKAICR